MVKLLEELAFFSCVLISILQVSELTGLIALGVAVKHAVSCGRSNATALADVQLLVPTSGAHVTGSPQ